MEDSESEASSDELEVCTFRGQRREEESEEERRMRREGKKEGRERENEQFKCSGLTSEFGLIWRV